MTTIDPLFVDTYSKDVGGRTPELMSKLIAAGPPWHGWWGKVSEGELYDSGSWLDRAVAAAKLTDRLGVDWWYGGYMYANVHSSWRKSLDLFLKASARAGINWAKGSGALNPCIDIETADNVGGTKQQWLDHVCPMVEAMREETGREVWGYGGSLLRDLGIRGGEDQLPFGFDGWEIARYSASLPGTSYTDIGVPFQKLVLWQYDGDGQGFLAHYPIVSPMGRTDISTAIVNGGGEGALQYLRDHT